MPTEPMVAYEASMTTTATSIATAAGKAASEAALRYHETKSIGTALQQTAQCIIAVKEPACRKVAFGNPSHEAH